MEGRVGRVGIFRRRTAAVPGVDVTVAERSVLLPGNMWAPSPWASWYGSTAGVDVTVRSATRSMAHWACQRVLVATISAMPVDVFRSAVDSTTPVSQPMVVRSPSGRVSRRAWVAQLVRSGVSCGNLYGRIVSVDSLGRATQVETIHSDDVTWLVEKGEEIAYINGVRQTLWPLGDFWHVPISQFLAPGTRVALSPTEAGKTSIGTAIAAEDHGARYFGDGAHPTMVAKAKVPISLEQAQAIKASLAAAMSGNRETPVIGADIDLEQWQTSLADSGYLAVLEHEVLQACRLYGVQPSKVFAAISGQNVTYSNTSQDDVQFLKFDIHPWIVDLEDAWSDLIAVPQSVKFNPSAVLRMDAVTQAALFEQELKSKTRTVNEVRTLMDRRPYVDPAFDEPGIPGGEKGLSVPELIAKLTPGVGVVITPDEGRQLLNDAGSQLDIPGPDSLTGQLTLPGVTTPTPPARNADPVVVNITNTPPAVTVEAAQIAVDARTTVQPTEVHVAPSPAPNVVIEAAEPRRTVRRVGRDADGRIMKIIDEEI